jgi:hypothetical protein
MEELNSQSSFDRLIDNTTNPPEGLPDGLYTYPGVDALYKKENGQWFKKVGGSSYIQLKDGNVAERIKKLESDAVAVPKKREEIQKFTNIQDFDVIQPVEQYTDIFERKENLLVKPKKEEKPKDIRIVDNDGIKTWQEQKEVKVQQKIDPKTGIPTGPSYFVKYEDITDPARVSKLNESYKEDASTSKDQKVFTGYPGKEGTEYIINEDNLWEVKRPGSDDFLVISTPESVTALNNYFKQKAEIFDDKKAVEIKNKNKETLDLRYRINKVDRKLILGTEENAQEVLERLFPEYEFEQFGIGTDNIRVKSKSNEITISLGSNESDESEALRLRSFLRENAGDIDESRYKAIMLQRKLDAQNKKYYGTFGFSGLQTVLETGKPKELGLEEKTEAAREEFLIDLSSQYKDAYLRTKDKSEKEKNAAFSVLKPKEEEISIINKYADDVLAQGNILIKQKKQVDTDISILESKYKNGLINEDEYNQSITDIKDKLKLISDESNSFQNNLKNVSLSQDLVNKSIAANLLIQKNKGSFVGGIAYSAVDGILSIPRMVAMADKETKDKWIEEIVGVGTTESYVNSDDRWDITKAAFQMSRSLSAMAVGSIGGTYGAYASLYAMSYYEMKDELDQLDISGVSEGDKVLMSGAYGLIGGALENFGLSYLVGKSPLKSALSNAILKNAFSQIPKNASKEMVEAQVIKSTKMMIAKYGITAAGSSLLEGGVEGTQRLAQMGIQEVYDVMKGSDYFNNKSAYEVLGDVAYESYMGFLGGGIVETVQQSGNVLKDGSAAFKDKKQLNLLIDAAKTMGIDKALVSKLKSDILNGNIKKEEAEKQLNAFKEMQGKIKSIPDDMSVDNQAKALDLILERDRLNKEIEGKDPNLVKPQSDRVTEINNSLQELSKQNAVQEPSTEGVLQREQEGVAETGGERGGMEQVVQGEEVTREGKTKAVQEEVVIDKPVIQSNSKTEVDRVKSLSNDAEDGATFNLDGTKYEGKGLIVPVVSKNTTAEELTPEMISDFVEEHKDKIGDNETVKVGIYKFPNSNQVSIDLNILAPESAREQAIEFGKNADQESLFDLSTFENVKTGGTGLNPVQFNNEQFREISKAFKEGRVPDVFAQQPVTQIEEVTITPETSQTVSERINKETDTKRKKVFTAVQKVLSAIPNSRIILHDNTDAFVAGVAKSANITNDQAISQGVQDNRGSYVNGDIHINLEKAGVSTVFHEAFHDLLAKKGLESGALLEMAKGLKSVISDKALKKRLDNFVSNYEQGERAEEYTTELGAIMAEAQRELSTTKFQQFKTLVNKIAKKLGLPVVFSAASTAQDAVDFMNSMSGKLGRGEQIEVGDAIKVDTNELSIKAERIGNFDVSYFEDANDYKKLVENGSVENNYDINKIAGETVAIHQPDNMFVGDLNYKGKNIFKGLGGVFYTLITGNVWASGSETSAKNLTNLINKSLKESTDGIGRLVLVRGSESKMISSTEGVKAAMSIIELLVDKGLINRSEFRSSLIRAGKKFNIDFSGKDSSAAIHKDIKEKFMDVKNSTFQKRGDFFDEVINDLSKTSKSVSEKENIDNIRKELGSKRKISFSKDGIRDSIGYILTERLLQDLPPSHVYAVIEVTEPVTYEERKGHDSYPWVLKSKSKPKLKLLSDRGNAVKDGVFEMIDGSEVTFGKLGLAQSGIGIAKISKQKTKINQIKAQKTEPVAGNKLFNEPLKDAETIAKSYMKSVGMEYVPVEKITKLDENISKRISDAYDKMKNDPNDPQVKKAYEAMAKETLDQYDQILEKGYNVEINNNEPYSSSEDMINDLRDNKRMKIFSTESGFGDEPITEEQRKENPLLRDSGRKDINGETLLVNDVFRFVHDFFGHAKLGNSFGPIGEENAWRVHSEMYSPEARKAMTSETRGQNSWVNFSGVNDAVFKKRDKARELRKQGKVEEADKMVGEVYEEMKFADQKVGLLPDFAFEEGRPSKIKAQIVGKNARLSQDVRDNLQIAREMEDNGKSDKEIRFTTGWERGADKKWRYEIDDNILFVKSRLLNEFKKIDQNNINEININNVISNELIKLYPEIKDVKIIFDPAIKVGNASYNSSTKTISISYDPNLNDLAASLLHEIQHSIQEIEGFAVGTSISKITDSLGEKLISEIESGKDAVIYNKLYSILSGIDTSNKIKLKSGMSKIQALLDKYSIKKYGKTVNASAIDLYKKFAGETEARNVENRMKMTPEERRQTTLQETEDVAREDQIIFFENKIKAQKQSKEDAIQDAKDIHEKSFKRFKDSKRAIANAVNNLEKSDWYRDSDDTQREEAVREIKEFFGEKIKKATSVAKVMGKTKQTAFVSDLAAAIRDQVKLQARSSRETAKDINDRRKALGESIKQVVKSYKGKITEKQLNAINRRIASVNLFNQEMVDRVVDYVNKVMSNAEYAGKVNNAFAERRAIRRMMKSGNMTETVAVAREFVQIDPSMVDDIDTYLEMAAQIRGAVKSSKRVKDSVSLKQIVNFGEAYEYIKPTLERQEEMMKNMRLAEYNDLVDSGVISKDMTLKEINKIINTIRDNADAEIKADEEAAAMDFLKDKLGYIKTLLRISPLKGYNPVTGEQIEISERHSNMINNIIKSNLDDLSLKQMIEMVDSLNNFYENGAVGGLEAAYETILGEQNAKSLEKKGIVARPLKMYFNKKLGQIFGTELTSLNELFNRMFVGAKKGIEVMAKSGFSDIIIGANKARRQIKEIQDRYVKEFEKTKDFFQIENVYERGAFAFLSRNLIGNDAEVKSEFNRRVDLLLESVEALKNGTSKEQEMAKIYEKVLDKMDVKSRDLDTIAGKMESFNKEATQWWINEWSKHYSDLSDVSRSVYNTILGKDINYTPDRYKSTTEGSKLGIDDNIVERNSAFLINTDSITDTNESGVMIASVRPKVLPKGRYVSLDFDMNNVDSLTGALVDINTAGAIRRLDSFFKSKSFKAIVPTIEDRKILTERVNKYIRRSKNKLSVPSDVFRNIDNALNTVSSVGTALGLGGVLQSVKQTVSVAISTAIQTGTSFKIYAGEEFNNWLNTTGASVTNRGQESLTAIESTNKKLKSFNGTFDKAIDTYKNLTQWQLKLFLSRPDVFVARAAFKSYYEQYLKSNGYDVSKINWSTWNETIKKEGLKELNDAAVIYADTMVSRQQNVSDERLAGELLASEDSARKLIRKALLPFASFSINQRARLVADINALFLNWNNISPEDKAIAIKSIAGTTAEQGVFQMINFGIGMALYSIAQSMAGNDDDDEEWKKRMLNATKYPLRSLLADMTSPNPLADDAVIFGADELLAMFGSPSEGEIKQAINDEKKLREMLGKEMTESQINKFKEQYIKDNTYQLTYNFTNSEEGKYGMFSIAADQYLKLAENSEMATNGTFTDDYMGNKTTKYLTDKDKSLAKAVFYGLEVPYTTGAGVKEMGQVANKTYSIIKKRALTENQYDTYRQFKKEFKREPQDWEIKMIKSTNSSNKAINELGFIQYMGGLSPKQGEEYLKVFKKFGENGLDEDDYKMIVKNKSADYIIKKALK